VEYINNYKLTLIVFSLSTSSVASQTSSNAFMLLRHQSCYESDISSVSTRSEPDSRVEPVNLCALIRPPKLWTIEGDLRAQLRTLVFRPPGDLHRNVHFPLAPCWSTPSDDDACLLSIRRRQVIHPLCQLVPVISNCAIQHQDNILTVCRCLVAHNHSSRRTL